MQKVHPGEIPPDTQHLIMKSVMVVFLAAINRKENHETATNRARAAANAGVLAWKVLNGMSEGA